MKGVAFLMALVSFSLAGGGIMAAEQLVYFGTGGQNQSEGIYVSRLDLETGVLSDAKLAAAVARPGFLALHPKKKLMYSVCALSGQGKPGGGGVSAFAIDVETGLLRTINQRSSGGAGPCHLSVDHTGQVVLVANYSGGSVAALPIAEDGSLGEATAFVQHKGSSVNPKRQSGPHAHSINVDTQNRFAFAADLGLDKIIIYRLDPATGKLRAHGAGKVAPGSGPRHFAFHPAGRFAYVINELASTITVFAYDPERGALDEVQTISTLPGDFEGNNSTAEVQVHPSGKFVYGSNRGHDTIAAYRVNEGDGTLSFIERQPIRGETPRNFGIDPTGAFLLAAGQKTNSVAVFRIDSETGALDFAGSEIEVPNPICIKFLPVD